MTGESERMVRTTSSLTRSLQTSTSAPLSEQSRLHTSQPSSREKIHFHLLSLWITFVIKMSSTCHIQVWDGHEQLWPNWSGQTEAGEWWEVFKLFKLKVEKQSSFSTCSFHFAPPVLLDFGQFWSGELLSCDQSSWYFGQRTFHTSCKGTFWPPHEQCLCGYSKILSL